MTYAGVLPKRWQVARALQERLRTIRAVDGFHHTVASVFLYEGEQLDLGPETPAIAIEAADDQVLEYLGCAKVRRRMTVNVWFGDRVAHAAHRGHEALEWGLADIVKVVQQDTSLGGLVTYIDVEEEALVPNPDDSLGLARVVLAVVYDRLQDDPTI